MPEQEQRIFNIHSITTHEMELLLPSDSGLPRKHLVPVALTVEGQQFIQIGSSRQVAHLIETAQGIPIVGDIVRLQHKHLPEHQLLEEGVKEVGITQLKKRIPDGQDLVEGGFAFVSRPGSTSIQSRMVIAIWAPAHKVLGEEWRLTDNPL